MFFFFFVDSEQQIISTNGNNKIENYKNKSIIQVKKELNLNISTFIYDEIKNKKYNEGDLSRYKLFLEIFKDVDGQGMLIRERTKLKIDDYNYIYSEIEYVSLIEVKQI